MLPSFCLCCRCWFRWAVPLLIRIGTAESGKAIPLSFRRRTAASPLYGTGTHNSYRTSTRTRVRWKRGLYHAPADDQLDRLESVRSETGCIFRRTRPDCKQHVPFLDTRDALQAVFLTVCQRFGAFPMRIRTLSHLRSDRTQSRRSGKRHGVLSPNWKGKFWQLFHANGYSLR